jgi:YcxB-like protein
MEIAYELSQGDFIEAYAAHRNRSSWRKWSRRVSVWITGLITAVILFGLLVKPSAQDAKVLMPYFGFVGMWLLIIVFVPRWNIRRQFLQQPAAHGPRHLLLDSLGTHWRWTGGSSDVEWKNYIRWVEGKNQLLVYTSPACFNVIPKRVLADEQLAELRKLLKQHIPVLK